MTTLQLLQKRRRAAAMEPHYCDVEERRGDIHDYDEVNGRSQHGGSSGTYDEFAYDMTVSTNENCSSTTYIRRSSVVIGISCS